MKILIVEDKVLHIESAKKLLVNHNLTIVTEFKDFFLQKRSTHFISWSRKEDLDLSCYDAVLTDVFLPSATNKGDRDGPTGLVIALKALEHGVKYVGIISDQNHHSESPIAKAFDMFCDYDEKPIQLGKSRMYIWGNLSSVDGKRWDQLLEILVNNKSRREANCNS